MKKVVLTLILLLPFVLNAKPRPYYYNSTPSQKNYSGTLPNSQKEFSKYSKTDLENVDTNITKQIQKLKNKAKK